MQDDWLAQTFVAPTGRVHTVQHGIEVKKSRSLKALLAGELDTSEQDLNPERFTSLRMRLLHDPTKY